MNVIAICILYVSRVNVKIASYVYASMTRVFFYLIVSNNLLYFKVMLKDLSLYIYI